MRGVLLAVMLVVGVAGCGRKPAEPTTEVPTPPRVVPAEPTAKAEPTRKAVATITPTGKAESVVGPVRWGDVFGEYKANEVAADLKYRGKRVVVTDFPVTHIGRNKSDLPYIGTLNVTPATDPTGVFIFAADQSAGVARLKVRQVEPVRFNGLCEGKVSDGIRRAGLNGYDFHVKFRDCRLLP